MRSSIRNFAALMACAGLAGCGMVQTGSDVDSLYAYAKSVWSGPEMVSLREAASVPYASLGLQLGDGPQVMLILASDTGGQLLWTSSARVAVTTQDGRIVGTAGFGNNLGGFEFETTSTEFDLTEPQTVRWLADFPSLGLYSIPIKCTDRPTGDETITVLGKGIHTRRISESCTAASRQLDWSFHNTYWVDPDTKLVWRSIQHVNPQLAAIETEVLRPPT